MDSSLKSEAEKSRGIIHTPPFISFGGGCGHPVLQIQNHRSSNRNAFVRLIF